MNRQLKFRVWDKKNKPKMRDHDWLFSGSVTYDSLFRERSDIIVMQFTGLLDKNGKEIYEGDILEFDSDEWGSTQGNRWAVEWDDEDGSWSTGGGTNRECRVWKKVIGNIYKNPDLLK